VLHPQQYNRNITVDNSSIITLYNRYAATLYGFILQFTNDQELANKILEESFVRIHNQKKYFDPGKKSIFTFMKQLTHATIVEFIHHTLPDNPDGLAKHVFIKAMGENCSPLHKKIFYLHYFKGLNSEQLAIEMKLPLSDIKRILREAALTIRSNF
jgi:RNA polymerase sigma-70 factor (ECF subfamily)